MSSVKSGDTVKVHYTGRLDDGTQFDTSSGREPLELTVGSGNIIPGFENSVIGMSPGDTKTVTVPSGEAYGDHRPDMVQTVSRDQIPPEVEVAPGVQLRASNQNGQPFLLTVVDVSDDSVTVDANHPLAGKDLTFDIELVEIV
ncbi:MAG: peptidylprolyl isomerase [Rhodospirillaceae bacterium]|nr:peptidylprolyl isomerase [Rhodospirillaceae bacterium]|tara:strand:- start:212 stop:640 length:429 start_codon:yes stop_codon:yes gene_type:complete